MMFKKWIVFTFVTLASLGSWAQVQRVCRYIHTPLSKLTEANYAMMTATSTTSGRGESKRVLLTFNLKSEIAELEAKGFKRRDAVLPGTTNITRTDYMPVLRFEMDGLTLAVKNRFRKYLVKRGNEMIPGEGYEDRSWFEMKIDHPNYPGKAVFKPRVLIMDSDIPLISKRETFYQHRSEIETRLRSMNPTDQITSENVTKMLHAMDQRYQSTDKTMDGMFVRTEYERSSYSLALQSAKFPGEKMDVQVTEDRDVMVTDLRNGKIYRPYKPGESVVEWKIPLVYIQNSPSDLQDAPALVTFQPFMDWANVNHVSPYIQDKGKMSQLKRFTDVPTNMTAVLSEND